jgi:hypothetical protein
MLELSPPLQILLLLCVEGLSGLNTRAVFLRSVLRLLVTANLVPSSPILVTLMMEAK